MKVSTILTAAASLFATSQAVVVTLYSDTNCQNDAASRNVYDNTCAYTQGFNSYMITTYGGSLQQLTAYSSQACGGTTTSQVCAAGVNAAPLNKCMTANNSNGGSNALSSYSEGGDCPN